MRTIRIRLSVSYFSFLAIFILIFSCKKNDLPNDIDPPLATTDFAPYGAKWYYSQSFAWSTNKEYLTIESVGDTIIEGKNCRIIETKGELACTYYHKKNFVYREKDVVYFYSPITNNFQILYNFKAQRDSSWINIFSNNFPYNSENFIDTLQVKVDSVTNLSLNGINLKAFYVTYKSLNKGYENWRYNGYIIEKIGDPVFLFNFQEAGVFCEIDEKGLKCYEDNQLGKLYFGPDTCNTNDWDIP